MRLKTYATVDGARVRVVIDIGYGDATEPGLIDIELPVLLDQPAPNLRAYSYETVIAEKFQAMVALGLANTRLKDFYDIWILAQTYEFNDDRLAQAIAATFARRKTDISAERPDGLTSTFASDPTKQRQWTAFVEEVAVNPGPLTDVVENLATFLQREDVRFKKGWARRRGRLCPPYGLQPTIKLCSLIRWKETLR